MRETEFADDIILPPSVLAALEGLRADTTDGSDINLNAAQLDALTKTLVTFRKKYRDYRTQSGIEDIWQKCEESYIGMDNANRHEFSLSRFQVPTTLDGPLTSFDTRRTKEPVRCTLYPRVTARYVDAGAAKVQEILIPPDELSFSYSPTPVPSLLHIADSEKPVMLPDGTPAERNARPDELAAHPPRVPTPPPDPSAPPEQEPGMPILERDLAAEKMDIARKAAKKAEQRVHDWQVEAQYASKMRRVIADAAKLGVGIMKGPFPTLRQAMAVTKDPATGAVTLAFNKKLVPDYKAISPWNLFPSPSCGEHVRDGEGLFERDFLSRSQVEALGNTPGYLKRAIAQIVQEGPNKKNLQNMDPGQPDNDERYEVWYWYGSLSHDEWQTVQDCAEYREDERPDPVPDTKTSVYVIVTLINDCLVYASQNPLQSGEIPFYTFPWQIRAGSWTGIGVAEQIAMPQRLITASTRALIDNAGKSAGSQILMDRDAVYPQDGDYTITRDKVWLKTPEYDDVRKAFALFQIPNVGPQLMEDIDYGFRLAEESCNIPLISQGQSGKTTPDTYGATKLQDSNANQLLRGIAATYDDCVNEPQARSNYEWLMLDPTVPDDEKGDVQINAHGSASLVERAIQDEAAVFQLELVMKGGEILGADPKKVYAQYLKAKRLNPADFQYSKDELDQKAKQPPPKEPSVQVAEIRAQVDMEKSKLDTDRDAAYVQAETDRTLKEHDARMQELALKRELELLRYANEQKISLMQVKSDLAQTSMKLATQKQLSGISDQIDKDKSTPEMTMPPSEPAGTAPVGESWQR